MLARRWRISAPQRHRHAREKRHHLDDRLDLPEAGRDPAVSSGGLINDWGTNAASGQGSVSSSRRTRPRTFVKLPTHPARPQYRPENLDYYGSWTGWHDAFKAFCDGIQRGG